LLNSQDQDPDRARRSTPIARLILVWATMAAYAGATAVGLLLIGFFAKARGDLPMFGRGIPVLSAATSYKMQQIKVAPIADLKALDLRDSFNEVHHGHRHAAIDIMKPRGTPVHAVVDGTVRKIFFSKGGGNTIYEFDSSETYCYYYAHLDHYAEGLHEGEPIPRGGLLGYVGSTGNASRNAPHLHFAIYALGQDKRWPRGTPLDPFPVLMQLLQSDS
jgi:peptidoglycan LD-endopeptidase LytH